MESNIYYQHQSIERGRFGRCGHHSENDTSLVVEWSLPIDHRPITTEAAVQASDVSIDAAFENTYLFNEESFCDESSMY